MSNLAKILQQRQKDQKALMIFLGCSFAASLVLHLVALQWRVIDL